MDFDEDNSMGFAQEDTHGSGSDTQEETIPSGIGIMDASELNETQKLQLAERANEIYRQQLKYMQDHLSSLRNLIQDKENIIENLMLRYDLGIIAQDPNRQGGNLGPDEIEMEELRRKAEALAQRTILENYELREMINELRDENFHLRNEIYELQDKISRQVLLINKLEKSVQQGVGKVTNIRQSDNKNMFQDIDDEREQDEEDILEDIQVKAEAKEDVTEDAEEEVKTDVQEAKEDVKEEVEEHQKEATQLKEAESNKEIDDKPDTSGLNETQKLQLAERANEIYRAQLKYLQEHLASLRSLIQDKENIIENLMLRYDLGITTHDSNGQSGVNLGPDEIEMEELRRKAEALAQRTILENFELREMVNELRDENFHLRNEIYELQDKINRQVLQINKLEKSVQQSAEIATNTANTAGQSHTMDVYEQEEEDEDMNDIYDAEEEEEQFDDAPSNDDARLTGRRESRTMDHPANSDEARAKRQARANHNRKESVKPPDMFGDGNSDSDYEMDGDAQAKHNERQNKTRKESVATPDIYGDAQGESEEDGDDEEDEEDEDVNGAQPQQTGGTKRRGSQIYMNEEAMAKRQARSNHRRGSSVAAPNLFGDNYDPEKAAKDKAKKYAPEAIQKRLQRKAKRVGAAAVKHVKSHRRKESLAEKLLLGPMMDDDIKAADMDPEERKELQAKARKEQRRKSRQLIKSQVGAKEHFSDDDVELQEDKPQRARRKKKKAPPPPVQGNEDIQMTQYTQQMNKKRASIKADPVTLSADDKKGKGRHRRDSSTPIVDLGFEDPDVLLHYEKLKVQDLEKELRDKLNELDEVKKDRDSIKTQINASTTTANRATVVAQTAGRELDEAIQSKADLAQKCAMEIMRLTMILNTLQQMPKFREIVQLLMDESAKDNKNNGSLLG
eukprot:409120_1